MKDHFPLPFIDWVFNALLGNNLFSFLDGFSGYNQIQIHPTIQESGTFSYRVLLLSYAITLAHPKGIFLSIFSYFIHEGMEIYMDDFIPYGGRFNET